MRTIPAALTWELFARTRWQLLFMMCAGIGLPMMLYAALEMHGAIDPELPAFVMMHATLIQINIFVFGAGLMTAMGPVSRLYAYPARTSTLVAAQLIPAALCMMAEMVVSTALLNALFDVRWPVVGPALFAAVAMSGIIAVAWLTEKSGWLPFMVGVMTAVFGLWFKSRLGPLFDLPTHYWTDLTVWDSLGLLAMAGLSYGLAVFAVSRNRCGEPPLNAGILEGISRLLDRKRSLPGLLQSPTESQLWYEWQKKGWAMPAGVAFGLIAGLVGWGIFSRDPQPLVDVLLGAGGALLAGVGFVGGILLGNCSSNDKDVVMGQFLATRPMTNAQLARIMLWNTAKSAVSAVILWVIAVGLIVGPLVASGTVDLRLLEIDWLRACWWLLPLILISPWVVAAGISAITLTGRSQPFLGIVLVGFTFFISATAATEWLLTDEQQKLFWQITFAILGIGITIGTGWFFILARRRELIDALTVWMSLIVWLILLVLVIGSQVVRPELPWLVAVFVCGMLALVVMPLAATPLALAWNRTR